MASSTQAEYLRMVTEIREDCGEVLLSDVSIAWLRDLRNLKSNVSEQVYS